jgi:hypothetical protein
MIVQYAEPNCVVLGVPIGRFRSWNEVRNKNIGHGGMPNGTYVIFDFRDKEQEFQDALRDVLRTRSA